jgi:hypothetical protein
VLVSGHLHEYSASGLHRALFIDLNIKEYGFELDGQWLSWLDAQFIDACHGSFDLHSAILRKIYQSMDLI